MTQLSAFGDHSSATTEELVLAADLDGTMFPNGEKERRDYMPALAQTLADNRIGLVYISGRNLAQVQEGIAEYGAPHPEHVGASVGSEVFHRDVRTGEYRPDLEYAELIEHLSPDWDSLEVRRALQSSDVLQQQEHFRQTPHKLSYYYDVDNTACTAEIVERVEATLKEATGSFQVIASVDNVSRRGLIDVMAAGADKRRSLLFIMERRGISLENVVYAGDSGNDLRVFEESKLKSIMVGNTSDEVKAEGRKLDPAGERIFQAPSYPDGRGNYGDGILLGLKHFSFIGSEA